MTDLVRDFAMFRYADRAVELALDAALGEISRQGGGSPQILKEARSEGILAATALLDGAERDQARIREAILARNLDTVSWSVRVENAFLNAGISTFGDLVTKTENDLRKQIGPMGRSGQNAITKRPIQIAPKVGIRYVPRPSARRSSVGRHQSSTVAAMPPSPRLTAA